LSEFAMMLPANIALVIERLNTEGYKAYAVGGCVRDAMRGVSPHDYDITTSALPQQVKAVFSDRQVIETGISHGTVTVLMDGAPVEITTFRVDGEYLDNRHPAGVQFTARIEDDLSRRDFTVNAMAYSPTEGLVDLFGGAEHLRQRVIACVGDADTRFNEDGLRILRALRFAAVLDFSIAEDTAHAIHRNRSLLKGISRERIHAELCRLLCGCAAGAVVRQYSDVLCTIIPALEDCTRWEIIADALPHAPADAPLRYALLLHQLGEDNAKEALRSLRADNRTCAQASRLVGALYDDFIPTRTFARTLARRLGYDDAHSLLALHRALSLADTSADFRDRLSALDALEGYLEESERAGDCVTVAALAVDGRDIAALGLSGKDIGNTLERLLTLVIEDRVANEREALLSIVKSFVQ